MRMVDLIEKKRDGGVLTDDVLIENGLDLGRLGQRALFKLALFAHFFGDNVVAEHDAFVADIHARPGHQLLHLILPLSAEGTLDAILLVCRQISPLLPRAADKSRRRYRISALLPRS